MLAIDASRILQVIYRLRGPDEKNCARGLENGPSPKGEGRFEDRQKTQDVNLIQVIYTSVSELYDSVSGTIACGEKMKPRVTNVHADVLLTPLCLRHFHVI